MAIRNALGAQRFTLIREQLTESLLICFTGARWAWRYRSPRLGGWRAHGKTCPARRASTWTGPSLLLRAGWSSQPRCWAAFCRPSRPQVKAVFATLQLSSRGASGSVNRSAPRKTLLTVEIAVTVVLLIAAGLLIKSFVRLRTTDIASHFGLHHQRCHPEQAGRGVRDRRCRRIRCCSSLLPVRRLFNRDGISMTATLPLSAFIGTNPRPYSVDQARKENVALPEKEKNDCYCCGREKPTGPITRLKE